MTGILGLRRRVLAGLLATSAAAACQSGTEPPIDRGPGQLIVSANVAGTPISTVVVEVSGEGISPSPLVFNLQLANGTATGTITVPAGSGRTIRVRAYDAAGIETHRGERSGISISEGSNNPAISISVLSLGGGQTITVTLSSHSIEVTPLTATVAVGGTVNLSATIRDASGAIVTPAAGELQWATNSPAVASVSADGVVTGVMVGSATIMATYRAVGAAAAITVSAVAP